MRDQDNTLKYGQMELAVELVTPAIAKRWLTVNHSNRRIRQNVVSQYARDMAAGVWVAKPIAVCFTPDDHLGNGQHTLSAIVLSGVAQSLLVCRNTPLASIAVMDRGIVRTIADVSNFIGVDMGGRASAVARLMVFGPTDGNGSASRSFSELFDAYQFHQESIDFAVGLSQKSVGFSSSSIAVMARAAYTRDRQQIARFATIIKTGVANGPHESAAIRFRDFCISLRGAGSAARYEVYQKAQSSLDNFLRGVPMSKLYGTTQELFPIPRMEAK